MADPNSKFSSLRNRLNPNAKAFNTQPQPFVPQGLSATSGGSATGGQARTLVIGKSAPQPAQQAQPQPTQQEAQPSNDSAQSDAAATTTTTATTTPAPQSSSSNNNNTKAAPTSSYLDLRGGDEEDSEEEVEVQKAPVKKEKAPVVKKPAKEHLNIVFIGHVDAGKSTLSGQILLLTGKVDQRTIERYEQEAKTKNRESWFIAFVMDSNEEEREKGITIEVGRGSFETAKKRYTILDAPGHKDFVPNMIGGASQADVALLVISARKGEFETGFVRGGQTREHTTLVKTLGVKQLIVLINKMDEPTVQWSKERYDEIIDQFTPFLKEQGYNLKNVIFMPVSGYTGANIKEKISASACPWYKGECLLDTLDNLEQMNRPKADGPLRIPISSRYKEMGVLNVLGKVESGSVSKGDVIVIMPNKMNAEVVEICDDEDEIESAIPGDNVRLKLRGLEEEHVNQGFVVCDVKHPPVPVVTEFLAQMMTLELKTIFAPGYSPYLHIHHAAEECTITNLVSYVDKKTGLKNGVKPKFVKSNELVIATISVTQPICVEKFEDLQQLGRFTLRDGKTIAIGKVIGLKKK